MEKLLQAQNKADSAIREYLTQHPELDLEKLVHG
jgi:hypothetical protein